MQRFPSKIDSKLGALVIVLPLMAGAALLLDGIEAGGPPWWSILPLVGAALLVVWIRLSTWYAFEGAALVVRSGPFGWRVPLEQIFAVRESNSVRSGPALSMDRLEVSFGDRRRILISPRDKDAFLQALRHQAPGLQLHTERPAPAS